MDINTDRSPSALTTDNGKQLWPYLVSLFAGIYIAYWYRSRATKSSSGPWRIPLIGNAHQIPAHYPWKFFQQWHNVYGPMLCLQLWQTRVFVLGDHPTARDVLQKRSSNYSSRPRLIVAGECVGKSLDTALLPYGPRWRAFHAVHVSLLNARRCRLYRCLQELESSKLLFNFLSSNDFDHEFYRYSSSLIFTLLYGKRFDTGCDDDLREIGHLAQTVFNATATGTWLVERFPILNCLPRPLARWRVIGDKLHSRQRELYRRHFTAAQSTPSWNWVKQVLSEPPSVDENELPFVLGELFGAGSRTTAGCLAIAVQACVSYPRAARRLQTELDEQVDGDRLPDFEDVARLHYLHAFVNEMLRWRPLTPSGVAHAPLRDDKYCDFTIPAGSIVIANHWSLDHDPKVFSEPDDFIPERWLEDPTLPLSAWGFGKRMCPGQQLATNSLMLVIARMLWAFDIAWDENQAIMPQDVGMTHEGLFSRPEPFKVLFKIRTEKHRRIIMDAGKENIDDLLDLVGREFVLL